MKALLLLGALALPLAPLTSNACTLENAYASADTLREGRYVVLSLHDDDLTPNCDGYLTTRFDYEYNDSCNRGFGAQSGYIWANVSAGIYRIDYVNGHCIKLCWCSQ